MLTILVKMSPLVQQSLAQLARQLGQCTFIFYPFRQLSHRPHKQRISECINKMVYVKTDLILSVGQVYFFECVIFFQFRDVYTASFGVWNFFRQLNHRPNKSAQIKFHRRRQLGHRPTSKPATAVLAERWACSSLATAWLTQWSAPFLHT